MRVLPLLLLLAGQSVAQTTYPATSASETDVEAAIALASDGDTVTVPAGTETWVGVAVPDGVYLKGAGVGQTNITTTITGGNCVSLDDRSRISDFTFTQAYTLTGTDSVIRIKPNSTAVILHDLELLEVCRRGVFVDGSTTGSPSWGVLYNSTLESIDPADPGGGTQQLITCYGADVSTPSNSINTSAGTWYHAPRWGEQEYGLYVEDCTLTMHCQGDSGCETYYGGNSAIRFNTCENFWQGVHGLDSTPRSGHSVLFHNNTIAVDIGTYWTMVGSRGGTGLVFNNTVTWTGSQPAQGLRLREYRSHGVQPGGGTWTDAFNYTGGHADGFNPIDGLQPYDDTASGTHTGSNNAANLTDSTKSWTTDEWKLNGNTTNNNLETGTHTGSDNASILTDSTKSWTTNALVGYWIGNWSDSNLGGRPSRGIITANTATTITVGGGLTGGNDQDFDTGDGYTIKSDVLSGGNEIGWLSTAVLWNMTDGSRSYVLSNTATGVTTTGPLIGGTDNDWDTSDTYVITVGWPLFDGNGVSGPQDLGSLGMSYTRAPWYQWSNTLQGAQSFDFFCLYEGNTDFSDWHQPASELQIQEDRDWFDYDAAFGASTGGVGVGTRAQMDAITPTVDLVGFWVTDEGDWNNSNPGTDGRMYQWDGDSWEVYYEPMTYPHPLRHDAATGTATATTVTVSGGVTVGQ